MYSVCGLTLTHLDGNASYRNYIIDAIYNMTPQQLQEGAKYQEVLF